MIAAIAVHGAPFTSQAPRSALRFCQAWLDKGNQVHRVFFYHDGVRTADTFAIIPQGDTGLLDEWVTLAEAHSIELAICIAASLKRGIVNEAEAQRYELVSGNCHPSFEVVGLGTLVEAQIVADRFITFGAG